MAALSMLYTTHSLSTRGPAARGLARFALAALVAASAAASFAVAAPIAVPNGDFSDPGNFGSVGGGLVGGSGTDVPIGTGPWLGTYEGVLGLLAPPSLTITDGSATIDGLAAANVLGILNNSGWFSQTLAVNFESGKRYTLAADVDTGTVLDIGVLSGGNFGLAITSGDATLASTATSPPALIDLQPLFGTTYRVALQFDATDATNGTVGVELFTAPDQLIGVSLLPQVVFDNVTLDATAIDPVSGTVVAVDPTPQTATVGEPFANALEVLVTDPDGDPVPGVTVTFTVPTDGASAELSSTTATTDGTGRASVTATANTIAGSYVVSASVEGVDTPAAFNLTNAAGAAATTIAAMGEVQSAIVGTPFPDPLVVRVTDAFGNPVEGVEVTFDAPDTGPSAVLSDDIVLTDENGLAQVTATANAEAGSYAITATVDGIAPPASFSLTNRLDEGTTVNDGSGDEQQASIGDGFACALVASVADANGDPIVGAAVDFVAPDSGASATLDNGVVTGTNVRAITDENGNATVAAVANDTAGAYVVTATLVGADGSIGFDLANIAELIFANGFDAPCAPPLP
jgi:protocatechuate 3,4-dioxygenase beta subunit